MKYLILVLILSACAPMSPNTAQTPQTATCPSPTYATTKRIVSFGDSNTAGIVDLVNGCPYAYEYKMAADYSYSLVNSAVGGSRIDMPGQLPSALLTDFKPTDVVTFIAGYNDMRVYGTNLAHLDTFKDYLRDFIILTASQTSLVLVGTTPQMSVYSGPEACPEAQAMYAQAVRDVVAQMGLDNVVVVDVASIVWENKDFEPDLVHFTQASQNRIAELFEQSF